MIGSVLAHYEIEALLGAGGMGVVYRAYDQKLRRQVAIKSSGTRPRSRTGPGSFAKPARRRR